MCFDCWYSGRTCCFFRFCFDFGFTLDRYNTKLFNGSLEREMLLMIQQESDEDSRYFDNIEKIRKMIVLSFHEIYEDA